MNEPFKDRSGTSNEITWLNDQINLGGDQSIEKLKERVSSLEERVKDLEHPNSLDAIVKKVK